MARISFRDNDGVLRWFDPTSAKAAITEGSRWNGNNHIGACSGLQIGRAVLYLTSGGYWIENVDASNEYNGPNAYRYLNDDEAREWLIRSADADRDGGEAQEALDRHFGEVPEENGPGRPKIGGEVLLRLGDVLPDLDAWAEAHGVKRPEAARILLRRALDAENA